MARVTAEVPAALLSGGDFGPGSSTARHPSPPTDAIRDTAFVWDDSNVKQNHKAGRSNSPSKAKYGAWYVPPNDWEQVYQPGGPDLHKEVSLAIRAGVGPGGRFPQGPEAHLQQAINAQRNASREDDLKKSLATSYATRIYKEHLNTHQLPEPAHLAGLTTPPDGHTTDAPPQTKRTRTAQLAGDRSPGAGSPGAGSPQTGMTPRTARTLMPQKSVTGPYRMSGMGNNPMMGGQTQRMSMSGNVGGPAALRSKGVTSDFHDLELDEIISADMRAAVRKTLAMNKLLEEHATTMKKYYAQRRKQQALATALKQRGIEPKTPTGGTYLSPEFLMAASPSQMQTLMSPGTGQTVGALVAAAHHLRTDGTLDDVTFQAESPVPQLRLPRHLAGAGRSVKFSNVSHRPGGPDDSQEGSPRDENDADEDDLWDQGDDQDDDQAGVEDLVWSDREGTATDQRGAVEQQHGPQPFAVRFDAMLQGRDHPHAVHLHADTSRGGSGSGEDLWDVPLPPALNLRIPNHLQLQLQASAEHVLQTVYAAAATGPPSKAPDVPLLPRVPSISIPMPNEECFLSDRSLTSSEVLKHVPSKLIKPIPKPPTIHMQLPATVQAHRHNVAHVYLPSQQPSIPTSHYPAVPIQHAPASGLTMYAAADNHAHPDPPSEASSTRPPGSSAPLAIHVIGCMAAKAKGLHNVAPLPVTRSPHHSAPTLRNPPLHPLQSGPRHPVSATQSRIPHPNHRSPSPAEVLIERGRAAGWLPGGPDSSHNALGPSRSVSRILQEGSQRQQGRSISTAPQPYGLHSDSPAAAEVLGLMNLSLAYLSGDRVAKPGSRPGIPLEAKGAKARRALALRRNGTAPCSLGRFAALECVSPEHSMGFVNRSVADEGYVESDGHVQRGYRLLQQLPATAHPTAMLRSLA